MVDCTFRKADEELKNKLYKEFQLDSTQVKKDVQIIQEWVKQMPHLPQRLDVDFIENNLIRNKFNIEKTKTRLETYFDLKAIHANQIALISSASPIEAKLWLIPLPFLNDKLERIVIIRLKESELNLDLLKKSMKYAMCVSEFSIHRDFCIGHRIIYDLAELKLEHIKEFTAAISNGLAEIVKSYMAAYFYRFAGIEYINVPTFVLNFFSTLRPFMVKKNVSKKVLDRMTIHSNLESLHKNIDKAFLPKDYGGSLGYTMTELLDFWNEEFQQNVQEMEKLVVENISDLSKRKGDVKVHYNDMFGPNGTFRELHVD